MLDNIWNLIVVIFLKKKELEKQAAYAAIGQEDRNIKQMEKLLKLNKRKSKSMPKSFLDDGLDCIQTQQY